MLRNAEHPSADQWRNYEQQVARNAEQQNKEITTARKLQNSIGVPVYRHRLCCVA
jgi:hypothetical protein